MKPITGSTIKRENYTGITCDSCRLLSINGIVCHETGCPNSGSRWDGQTREWVKQRKCFDCGYMVDIDDPCCQATEEL